MFAFGVGVAAAMHTLAAQRKEYDAARKCLSPDAFEQFVKRREKERRHREIVDAIRGIRLSIF